METCIRFADENAAQHPVTSMLANSPSPAKDKTSGGGQAGKPGGKPVVSQAARQVSQAALH